MTVQDKTLASQERRKAPGPAKRRILDAAARLFRARGFARSTVRELADAVGILSGSLFHHFKSKDEILFAVMEEVIIDMDASLAERLQAVEGSEARIRALIHNQLEFTHGPRADATAVLVHEWNALSPEGQAALLERRRRYFERWHEVFLQAREEGLVHVEPTVLQQLLHGAVVWTAYWYDPEGQMGLQGLEDAALSLVLK
ncbi:MAG: TetR/AcrR family transcriptional regulator [Rhodobacteraceae bacterium]|nr:TetR/AcrR family transcriptional regulator [Paracoccaceae bacterium]